VRAVAATEENVPVPACSSAVAEAPDEFGDRVFVGPSFQHPQRIRWPRDFSLVPCSTGRALLPGHGEVEAFLWG
jgi:hypothetical protein